MGYKVVCTSDAWARVLWPREQKHDAWMTLAIKTLKRIPGVRDSVCHIELPCTVWMLDEVRALWSRIGDSPYQTLYHHVRWFPARPLYAHQQPAVDAILGTRGTLLADDMGLGKSASAITAAETIRQTHGGSRPVIIISTLSSRNVWRKELRELGAGGTFHFLATRDLATWVPNADWYFVHFDVTLTWQTKLQGLKACCVILDEAHNIKNGRTQRGKGVYAVVATAPRRIALTGTPMENRPSDLWHLLTMLTGPSTWGSPNDFKIRYGGAQHTGFGLREGEPTHVAELQARMAPFYLRRTALEAGLDLPPLTRHLETVGLSRALQHEHDEVLAATDVAQLVHAIQSGSMRDEVLETLTRLRHVTSVGKIPATVDYVRNAQDQGEGVVVFTWEKNTAHLIAKAIAGAFVITGDDPQMRREHIIEQFQQTPGSVLVATLGALRESVTLHTARIVVLHDWHWVLTHLLQAEARVWRAGQRRACQAVWMMAENSIDTILARVLYEKSKAMKVVGLDKGLACLEELGIAQLARDAAQDRVTEMLEAWL